MGWGGHHGASTHSNTDRWWGCRNNGMAASQTELPYCSDKGTGRRGAAQEVDTPASAAGATAATVTSTGERKAELDSNVQPLIQWSEGISGLCESMSDITALAKSWKWQMKEDKADKTTLTDIQYAVHSHNTDEFIHVEVCSHCIQEKFTDGFVN